MTLAATVGCFDDGSFIPTVTTVANGLNNPTGLAVRPDGTLLVAESGAGRIAALDADGNTSTFASEFSTGTFFPYDIGPLSLMLLEDGTLVVGEGGESTGRERISFYDTTGVELPDSVIVPVSGSNFNGLALHPTTGDLYAVSTESDRIFRLPALDGGGFGSAQEFVAATAQPPISRAAPSGLAFEPDGMLLVAFSDFEASGILRLTTESDAGSALVDVLYETSSIVTSVAVAPSTGEVFFTEAVYAGNQLGRGRVGRFIERDGAFTAETYIDDVTAPAALAFGPNGALYVATLGATPNTNAGGVLMADSETTSESEPAGLDDTLIPSEPPPAEEAGTP